MWSSIAHILTLLVAWGNWADTLVLPASVRLYARRIPGRLIGYRSMSEDEWALSEAAGDKLIYTAQGEGGAQLGNGVYTSMEPLDWAHRDDYVCAVVLSDEDYAAVGKYLVPAYGVLEGSCIPFYFEPEIIEEFGQNINPTFTNDNTIRAAPISGEDPPKAQAVIGGELVNRYNFRLDCCPPSDLDCIDNLEAAYGSASYSDYQVGVPDPEPAVPPT